LQTLKLNVSMVISSPVSRDIDVDV